MANHHLSDFELKELMNRYYAGENIRALIEEFKLVIHTNNLVKIFPDIELDDLTCPFCDLPQVIPPYSRSSGYIDYSRAFCQSCGHKNFNGCSCNRCVAIKESKKLEKKKEIEVRLKNALHIKKNKKISIENISLSSAVNLVGLCRGGLMENSDQIEASEKITDVVVYDFKTRDLIYSELSKDGLIDISIQSSLKCLDLLVDSENKIQTGYLVYELTLGDSTEENLAQLILIEHILKNQIMWPHHWYDELKSMWIDLALEEIFLYLSLKMREHQLEPQIGEKTKRIFTDLLKHFSVYQIYNFIWGAVTNAVAYKVRKGLDRRHTANLIPGNCQQRAEKAKCENWTIKDYRRDISVSISTRVNLFSNVVTDLGDRFFTCSPDEMLLHQSEDRQH